MGVCSIGDVEGRLVARQEELREHHLDVGGQRKALRPLLPVDVDRPVRVRPDVPSVLLRLVRPHVVAPVELEDPPAVSVRRLDEEEVRADAADARPRHRPATRARDPPAYPSGGLDGIGESQSDPSGIPASLPPIVLPGTGVFGFDRTISVVGGPQRPCRCIGSGC